MARKQEPPELPEKPEHPVVQVRMLPETYEQARSWMEERGVDEDEGWHTILAAGLAQLRGERRFEALNAGEADAREELDQLFQQVMDLESRYAGLRFRSFELDYENRVLGYNLTGYQVDNRGLVNRIGMFREEVAALKAEREALRREVAELRERLGEDESLVPGCESLIAREAQQTGDSSPATRGERPETRDSSLGARLKRLFS